MSNSAYLQQLLERHHAGDDEARGHLLQHSLNRFRGLARKFFPQTSDLRRLDETDDVIQKAVLRLNKLLAVRHPPNVRAYMGLASRQIRYVLLDLAREAAAAKAVQYTPKPKEVPSSAGEPADSLAWAEFHTKIEALPEEERETFDVLFYQGLEQAEAAKVLGISLRTMKRRWLAAKLCLHASMGGCWPPLEA